MILRGLLFYGSGEDSPTARGGGRHTECACSGFLPLAPVAVSNVTASEAGCKILRKNYTIRITRTVGNQRNADHRRQCALGGRVDSRSFGCGRRGGVPSYSPDEVCREQFVTARHSVMYTTIALQYLAVLPGIAWGRAARTNRDLPTLWSVPAALALIMLLIALFRLKATQSAHDDAKTRWLLAALIVYDVIVMVFDPFVEAANEVSCIIGVTLVMLPLFCLKPLVRRRAWLAISGVVLFQMTAVASLMFNFPAMRGGFGYFYLWLT